MLQQALDEKTQANTNLHDVRRQQEPVAKRPACALSEVLKKEVSEALLHAKTLSAKEGKDFLMKLRLKFHPGEPLLHEGG